jgi:hypothetical protein
MRNITFTYKANEGKLLIEVDLSRPIGPSSTGKTIMLASTEGNAKLPGTDIKFGLNVFTPRGEG